MERKYYLRGLGLGIAMTAIIMGVALSGNKKMSDAEVIARAKELGMVENTVLLDLNGKDEEENTDYIADETEDVRQQTPGEGEPDIAETDDTALGSNMNAEAGNAKEDVMSNAGTDEIEDDGAEDEESEDGGQGEIADVINSREKDLAQQEPESNEPEENVNDIITSAAVKTITVKSGDGSYTVARKLADAGVVTSAETFDTFLCQNGYDKRLRTGTFSIPADASDEQIARIVTGAE